MENDQNEPPLHKPCHITARFNFIKTFLEIENYFLEQVLRINETKTELFGQNDVLKISWKKSEAFHQKNSRLTLKYGGSSVLLFGCFSSKETGLLIAKRGITESEDKYIFWMKLSIF